MDNIILYDENDNEVEFQIIDTFEVDDKKYAAMEPVGSNKILITETYEKEGEVFFKGIEDQDELDEIIELYEELKKE